MHHHPLRRAVKAPSQPGPIFPKKKGPGRPVHTVLAYAQKRRQDAGCGGDAGLPAHTALKRAYGELALSPRGMAQLTSHWLTRRRLPGVALALTGRLPLTDESTVASTIVFD